MTTSTLPKKLQMKPGQRGVVLNTPEGYPEGLISLPEGFELLESLEGGQFDFVQVFVKSLDELHALLPQAREAVKYDALLWIAYPKGSKKAGYDVNRDTLHAAASTYGVTGIALISLDDTWSCMRFRPTEKVESKRA